jgi:hypothetical protein
MACVRFRGHQFRPPTLVKVRRTGFGRRKGYSQHEEEVLLVADFVRFKSIP